MLIRVSEHVETLIKPSLNAGKWVLCDRFYHSTYAYQGIGHDLGLESMKSIKKLVIGYNINWKNKINMGRKNNGKFYSIPYRRFVNMIFYKGLQEGINVVETDESYTSKCDALTNEEVRFQKTYTGHRKHRGLFTSGIGFSINADINGAINILRKYINRNHSEFNISLRNVLSSTYQINRFLSRFYTVNFRFKHV